MFMEGAPSQLDLFDYKPRLVELDMQPCPEEMIKGERFAFIKGGAEKLWARRISSLVMASAVCGTVRITAAPVNRH